MYVIMQLINEGTVYVTRSAARQDAEILPPADDDAEKDTNKDFK